jgi:hypothetical protein
LSAWLDNAGRALGSIRKSFDDEAVLILLGKLSRGADDLVGKLGQIHRLEIQATVPIFR